MPSRLRIRSDVAWIYGGLVVFNILAWAVALLMFRSYPILLGTSLLAYTFGLRHAVDVDHIAAIDNVTRKLMHDGKRPATVGLFFSLGHSSVVILASVAIVLMASVLEGRFREFKEVGGLIGTTASAAFLFAIAFTNIAILIGVYRSFRQVKSGGSYIEDDLDVLLANRGLLGRLFRPIFKLVRASWHMYPLGVLFGLGFDTATEIGILGISAEGAAQGLPIWSIMIFPALFTAGMTLVDTTDSILMMGAYGWAFMKPIRKLYYNMTITLVSVSVALVVGSIEALGIVGNQLGLRQGFWRAIAVLNSNFGALGYLIVAVFLVSWIVSVVVYRVKGYDRLDVGRA